MCGIFGYLSADPGLDEERVLTRAVEALWHRGPDDRGTFRARHGGDRVGFAHTRLSIIDLSAGGHQPMLTPDGRYAIVYNGEIYNFQEIRAELEALGDVFRSTCDTEVALHAYARWGAGALTRFRGMFALAIWDERDGTLFLARDRLGIKPLYYTRGPRGFAFASEVRALLVTGFAERRLSRRALNSYFAFGAVSGPDTILEGVTSVPPGHWLRVRDGEVADARLLELARRPRSRRALRGRGARHPPHPPRGRAAAAHRGRAHRDLPLRRHRQLRAGGAGDPGLGGAGAHLHRDVRREALQRGDRSPPTWRASTAAITIRSTCPPSGP